MPDDAERTEERNVGKLIAVDAGLVNALEDVEAAAEAFSEDPTELAREALGEALGELVARTGATDAVGAHYPTAGALGIAPTETFLGIVGTGGIVARVPVAELRAVIDVATAATEAAQDPTPFALDALRAALAASDAVRGVPD